MNPPPNREVVLFSAALELAVGQRAAYLDQACADDPALRLRIEALLRIHEEAIPFLENPAPAASDSPMGAAASDATVRVFSSPSEKPGDRIGRYKLLQQIGEGGCGVVYMAEQTEPVRRRVALKVIKLGMDTRQVVARFEAERQALALMDHPNIAKVLDAGATDTGRPYFVMELVRGIKITEYCDQNNLSTEDRLKLFTQVCQAIQHAHQKGIIHRDIKPSNILVTVSEPGAPGCPKVIDFGIAKATTDQRLTDKTVFTAFEQFIGTPAYMSPEQATMTALDIDTRADIYALGVLLYELLTGQTPFDTKDLMAAGLDAMRRIINEREPVRPSTRLSTMLELELTTTANHRHTDAPKLVHLLRGDLDWIVMKALEKDRARRYETANGLAEDITRHLNCEPVLARPPSRLYEFQKTVRRHKFGFAAAAALITVLTVGVVASTSEAIRATRAEREQARQRQIAETKEKKSEQVAQFLKDMLNGVGPSVALGRDTTMLREILDKAAQRLNSLKGQPEVEADMRATLGNVYADLGEYTNAAAMHREALALRKKLLGDEHPEVADSLTDLGGVIYRQGKFAEAETLHREALAMRRKLLGAEHLDVATSLDDLARMLEAQSKRAEAETVWREALAMRRKLLGNQDAGVAYVLHPLAWTLSGLRKLTEAEALSREELAIWRKHYGNEHPNVGWALGDLTIFLREQGKLAEAESTAREALAIARKQSGSNPAAVTTFLRQLAWVLYGQGKPAEAENISREELAIRRKVFGNEHPEVAATLQCLATFLGDQGKTAEAEITIREALTIREKKLPDDWQTFNARSLLGDTLLRQKKYAEAEPFLLSGYEGLKQREDRIPAVDLLRLKESLQRIVQLYEAVGQPEKAAEWNKTLAEADGILLAEVSSRVRGSGADPEAWLQRAWIETDLNAWKAAIQDYDKAIALSKDESAAKRMTVGEVCVQFAWRAERAAQPEFAERVARQAVVLFRQLGQEDQKDSRVGLGLAGALSRLSFLLRAGRLPEAEATAREALAIRKKLQGNEHANVAESLHLLAWNLNLQGKHTEAEALSRQEVAMWRKLSGNDDPNVAGALGDLTVFLRDQEKLPEAETTIRESLAIRRKRLGDTHPDTANSFSLLVGLLCTQGKLAQAEAVWREELAIRRKLQGSDPLDVAAALIGLSLVLREEGSLPEAVATAREALAIRKKLLGNEHAEVAVSLHVLAWNLSQEGKLIEAEALSRDELAMRRKLSGNDDPDVAWTLRDLTFFLRDQGKLAEAETAIRESLAIRRKRLGDTHPDTVNSFSLLICLLCTQGKLAEAKSMFQEARERGGAQELNEVAWLLATSPDPNLRDGTNAVVFAEKAVAATSRTNASYLDTLAAAHAEEGQFGTAVSVQQEAIALLQTEQEKKDYASRLKLYENHSPYRDHGLLAELVSARLREGKFAEAEGLAHECLAQREREIPDDWRTFNARSMLGGALLGQKKHADAEPFLLSGYEGMKRREVSIPAQGKVRLGEALQRLVQLYGATGRPDQAAEWKKKLKLLDNQETAAAPEEPTK